MVNRIRKHIDLNAVEQYKSMTDSGIFQFLNTLAKTNEALKAFVQLSHIAGIFPSGIKELARHGWYISNEIELQRISKAVRNIGKKDVAGADRLLLQFYTDNLDDIKDRLCQKCPERKVAIEQAVKSHELKLYYSSTPSLLIIADGICNGKLYKQNNGRKPGLQEFLEKSKTDRSTIVVEILTEISAIDSPIASKGNYFSELNRHEVIHGLDLHYGTEINSLKALSLLCFVVDFVK